MGLWLVLLGGLAVAALLWSRARRDDARRARAWDALARDFTLGSTGFHYGVDFPGTVDDFGKADQFQQTAMCGGPFGPNSTYCSTIVQ